MSDVVVIGAGVNGLVAATYLARGGADVVVLEAEAAPGGACSSRLPVSDFTVPAGPHALSALDFRLIKDLRLPRLGFKFAVRDLPLVGLRVDNKPLSLTRDKHETHRAIAQVSPRDAERFAEIHRNLFAFGRAMRQQWWEEGTLQSESVQAQLRRLRVTSAAAWLESVFESEALRALFAFDALQGGHSPAAAGTSLVLAWQAAQEMSGLQGAVAVPRGGPAALVDSVLAAARAAGVDVRTDAEVARLEVEGDVIQGAVLANGEVVSGAAVLSSLSRRRTLLELLPPGAVGFAAAAQMQRQEMVGEAKVVLALSTLPSIFKQPGRFIAAERLDGVITAHAEARSGTMPSEIALEVMPLESGPAQPALLSVLVRPLPVLSDENVLSTRLLQSVLRILEHHAPDLTATITGFALQPPKPCDLWSPADLLKSWRERIVTPIRGLYLCGEAAEPVPVLSGRAARIAAGIALQQLKEAKS